MACAVSPNLNMLIGFRFLSGCVGAAPLTIGGGIIADVVPQEMRGKAVAVFVMGPLVGPTIGPFAGGYLAEVAGWRWIFWLIAILDGIVSITTFFFLNETYVAKLLQEKAHLLRRQTGNPKWKGKFETGILAYETSSGPLCGHPRCWSFLHSCLACQLSWPLSMATISSCSPRSLPYSNNSTIYPSQP